jgi:hypothetical protein
VNPTSAPRPALDVGPREPVLGGFRIADRDERGRMVRVLELHAARFDARPIELVGRARAGHAHAPGRIARRLQARQVQRVGWRHGEQWRGNRQQREHRKERRSVPSQEAQNHRVITTFLSV